MVKTIYDLSREYRDEKCGVTDKSVFSTMLGIFSKKQFDGDDLQIAVEFGANTVLEEIENVVANNEDNTLCMARCLVEKIKELKGE